MSANINNCWRGTPAHADSKSAREELAVGERRRRRRLLREGEPVEPVILGSKYIMPR